MDNSRCIGVMKEYINSHFGEEFYKLYLRWLKNTDNIVAVKNNVSKSFNLSDYRNEIECMICTCDIINTNVISWREFFTQYIKPKDLIAHFSRSSVFEKLIKDYKHYYSGETTLDKTNLKVFDNIGNWEDLIDALCIISEFKKF